MKRWSLLLLAATGCIAPADGTIDDETTTAADAIEEVTPPPNGGVSFGRDLKEGAHGVHIKDKPHRHPKVVYSVRLADLGSTETLFLRGEVTLSRCNPKDIAGLSGDAATTPCDSQEMKQSPYGYAPRFSAAFVLAGSANDADGERVSPWFDKKCPESHHHCALALPEVAVDGLPDAPEMFVNLVVTADADGANAKSWHVMEIEHNHGALQVTRAAPGAELHALHDKTTKLLSKGPMGVDQTEDEGDPTQVRRLLYQVKLQGLQGGDVIDADAAMRAVLGNYACDPLITGEILVTEDPKARKPKGKWDGRLTARNGRNCSDHSNDGCRYEKSGAVRLRNGTPSTLYVSYLATALRSCAAPNGGDKWHVDDGFLDVNVRR
jgi:hypothetical protein